MKYLSKISIQGLPPGLEAALVQQFGRDSSLSLSTGRPAAEESFDLVISATTQAEPGTPVLVVDTGRRLRLGALLRQAQQMIAEPALYLDDFRLGPYLFRPAERALSRDGAADIALTDKETGILVYLAKRRGAAAERDDLLRNVWRYQEGVDTHTLETHVYRLRQKIEAGGGPALLVTDEGGYRLAP